MNNIENNWYCKQRQCFGVENGKVFFFFFFLKWSKTPLGMNVHMYLGWRFTVHAIDRLRIRLKKRKNFFLIHIVMEHYESLKVFLGELCEFMCCLFYVMLWYTGQKGQQKWLTSYGLPMKKKKAWELHYLTQDIAERVEIQGSIFLAWIRCRGTGKTYEP